MGIAQHERTGPRPAEPPDPLLALWIARMSVRSGASKFFADTSEIAVRRVQWFLGLEEALANPAAIHDCLSRIRSELEAAQPGYGHDLEDKARQLRALFGLAEPQCRILIFLSFASGGTGSVVADAYGLTLRVAGQDCTSVIACALAMDEAAVAEALEPEGRLLQSGLVRTICEDRAGGKDVFYNESEVKALTGLLRALLSRRYSLTDFFEAFLQPRAALPSKDFDFGHIAAEYGQLCELLQGALREGPARLNVLITGEPGVGKTILAHCLAYDLGLSCFEVPSKDPSHQSIDGLRRFHRAQLAQNLLAGRRDALLVFDEIEDVLVAHGGAGEQAGKAWTNRLLEGSPVPTLWIANSVGRVDRSHLRRFDYLLELRHPPPAARKRMLARAFANQPVSPAWLDEQAADDGLTPAQIGQLGALAERLDRNRHQSGLEGTLERQLHRHQRLQGRAPSRKSSQKASPLGYELAHVSAEPAPARVRAGLVSRGAGRVLLHGPAGTGKTAFAHELAEALERQLLMRHASELLSALVGETERRLAALFTEAHDTGAVLCLDEADSFLGARDAARQRWEITETNELLAQMEAHKGILLMASNRIGGIDAAAMRRFDVRMAFGYPDADARWGLFERLLEALAAGAVTEQKRAALRARLDQLDRLTPGDFATVARRLELLGGIGGDPNDLIDALADEHAARMHANGATLGFL